MATVADIEGIIRSLPTEEFLHIRDVVYDRERELLGDDEFESPELEAEILKGMEGPFTEVNEEFYERIRRSWITAPQAPASA